MNDVPLIEELWAGYAEADRRWVVARRDLVQSVDSYTALAPILNVALHTVRQRWTALHLLLMLDDAARKAVFPALFELASIGHGDIALVRQVIEMLPHDWLDAQFAAMLPGALANAGDEEFRRYAELLYQLKSRWLDYLVEQAATHPDPDVREVAEDFAPG